MFEMDYFIRCLHLGRQNLVPKDPQGRKNSMPKANKHLQDLKKDELIRDLYARGIFKGNREELHGLQRILCFTVPKSKSSS